MIQKLQAFYYPSLYLHPDENKRYSDYVVIAQKNYSMDVIPYALYKKQYSSIALQEMEEGTYMPALVNAHNHLDNCYLQGKTTQGKGFYPWLQSVLANRVDEASLCKYAQENLPMLLKECTEIGYTATIANFHFLHELLQENTLPHCIFYESIGQHTLIPENHTSAKEIQHHCMPSTISYAGHSLYSTTPEVLQKIHSLCTTNALPFSIHVAEHEEECAFLAGEESSFGNLLKERLLPNTFIAPRKSPVEYAHTLSLLNSSTIAVHCVYLSSRDMEILKHSGATVALCPRSNTYIGVGIAKAQELYKRGIPLCLATDGLASNTSLSLWDEIVYAMELYGFTLEQCLPMVTTIPAKVLGINNIFGRIAKGYYSTIVKIPEYLL